MRLKGQVSSIVDFGAFVDLGGIDGLVHISELSWNHVNHPSEVVKVGDEVEVEVLDVDLQRERISLGLKQTTEDPWLKLVENYPVGTIVDGKVTKLVPFGAFVELEDSVEGLVHISEMAPKHIDTPAQVAKQGDEVKVKVMDINTDRRRISLSMKAAAEELGFEIDVDESLAENNQSGDKKGDDDAAQADTVNNETTSDEPAAEPSADAQVEAMEEADEKASEAAQEEPAEEPEKESEMTDEKKLQEEIDANPTAEQGTTAEPSAKVQDEALEEAEGK